MTTALIKDLFNAGAHFGHQTRKWNPQMKRYIFDKRNGIHIINLEKTAVLLQDACDCIRDITADGGKILFVGTKKQAQGLLEKTAQDLDMPYVNQRWLGGMLTNIKTVHQSVSKLEKFLKMDEDGSITELSKKSRAPSPRKRTASLKTYRVFAT